MYTQRETRQRERRPAITRSVRAWEPLRPSSSSTSSADKRDLGRQALGCGAPLPAHAASPSAIIRLRFFRAWEMLQAFLMAVTIDQRSVGTKSVGEPPQTSPSKTRTMEIKCGCGSLLKFRDPMELGYQPYPSGDSITCPNCGKVMNLKELRKLETGAQA